MLGWWEYSCISWIFRTEDGQLQCIGQCSFTIFFFFHKLNLIAAQVFPLIYVFSMAAFRLQRQNQLRQRPYGLQVLKYLLCDPLQIKLAESWFRRTRMKTSCDFPGVPVVKNLPCNATIHVTANGIISLKVFFFFPCCSFLWLNSIPLFIGTTSSLSIHLLMDI